MTFVIYNKNTTHILCDRPSWERQDYGSKAAATRALNRIEKKMTENPTCSMARWDVFEGKPFDREMFAVAETGEFHKNIEKKVIRHNLLSGQPFEIAVNTPACCDPSTETYHCM